MDRLLTASKDLSEKIDSNDGAVNDLLHKCENLQQMIKAMIQYQSAVQEISGGEDHPRGPPRIEFSYIRQLQQDNSELRSLLEDHQAALDMIMRKYRQQMTSFLDIKNKENSLVQDKLAEEVRARTDQVCEMATVMYQAAQAEDSSSHQLQERVSQLEYENKYLRDILSLPITGTTSSETSAVVNESVPPISQIDLMEANHANSSDSDDSRSSTPKADSR